MRPEIGTNNSASFEQYQLDEIQRINQTYNFNLIVNADFTDTFSVNPFGLNSIGPIDGTTLFKVETLTDDANRSLHQRGANQPYGVRDHAHYNRQLDNVLKQVHDSDGKYLAQCGAIDGDIETGAMCTSWIDTYGITFRGPNNSDKGPDPSKPNVTFGKNTYFEIHVNFSKMNTPGFRHSCWLMPATSNVPDRGPVLYGDQHAFMEGSTAYDGRARAKNGVEIDIYEHEISPGNEENMLMKVIAGNTSADNTVNLYQNNFTPPTHVDIPGINAGWHRIGLLWAENELVWFVDGVPYVRDVDLMPNDARMFLLVTRELSEVLFGQDPSTPENRQRMINDMVMMKYIRVWSVSSSTSDDKSTVPRVRTSSPDVPSLTVVDRGPRVAGTVSSHFYNRGVWLPIGEGYEAKTDNTGSWSITIPAHEQDQANVNAYVSNSTGLLYETAKFNFRS